MKYPGQYKTERELREEIKALEKIGARGDMTMPEANALNRLRSELETIRRATDPTRRPWIGL